MTEQEEFEFRARREKEKTAGGKSTAEPSFGEKTGAFAYGLGTGVAGTLGEVEKFGAYTVPEYFGFQEEGKRDNVFGTGRETIFPTVEEAQKVLGKVGIKKPREEVSGYQTAGELAPAVLGGAKALYGLGKYGIGKAADLGSMLLGRKTTSQAGQVGKEAASVGSEAEKALIQQESETRRLLAKEQEARAASTKSQAERQAMAETAAAKAAPKGERSLRELVGVKTLPEAGGFKPIPQTPTQVGNFVRQQAENFVKSIKSQRDAAAKTGFANAKNEAALKQSLGQYVDTQPLVREIDSLIAKGGSSDYIRSISQLKNDLAVTRDFEGLEVIRRRLGDAAFGLPEEGYKAIGQGFAKDMYKNLSGEMKKYSSDFEKYLEDYARLSKNIEAHGTKVGKGLTETQDSAGKYYAKPAEQVANDIFSSPEKYKQFVDAVGGNLEIATSAGRKFFAGKLEAAKTPEAVEKILKDSRELLRQPGMAGAKQDLETYLASLRQSSRRTEAATAISTEAKGAQEVIARELKDLDKVATEKLKGIAGAKTLMSDAVSALSSAKPGKAIETFESTVLPKIRDAEAKAGTKLLSEQQIETLRQQVQRLEEISDKTTRARIISGVIAGYLIGETAVDKLRRLGGMPGVGQ